jgi:glycosyltransferase involved in cell wall biosynthesis
MNPATRFLLLTQAASNEELAVLDGANVERLCVVGTGTSSVRARTFAWGTMVVARLPRALRARAARVGYRVHQLLKRGRPRSFLRDLRVDLLFCPFTAPTFREAGIPTVCTIYDLQYRAYPEFFSVEDAVQRERAFAEACRHAARLASISEYSRAVAIAQGGVEAARIATIHPRLDAGLADKGDSGAIDRLRLAKGRYFLYPANFWRHKNHEMLLTAFGMARAAGLPRDVKLVCTGSPGPRSVALHTAARRMGLEGTVVFPGYLARAELVALLDHCGGLVFPSLYEGFGMPLVEAMARGVPVACSNVTALPEVAASAALLFDPRVPAQIAAAMTAVLQDAPLRARLMESGRERARDFSDASRMAGEYWRLFAQAMADPVAA